MNKSLAIALALCAMAVASCSEADDPASTSFRILTFEDSDASATPWSSLIDSEQYGGSLLYGDEPYVWADLGNTGLSGGIVEAWGTYKFWNNGIAISNYASTELSGADYTRQLEVYGTGGHDGSANFAVLNGYNDPEYGSVNPLPALSFADGIERVIDHMWVNNCTYVVASYLNGDAFSPAATDSDWLKIEAIGYDAGGNRVGTAEFTLCDGRKVVSEWTKWY
ncbi:MAG: DUF4465 domain-containing protein, partial [Muribaculaceae bacterium]|nr:DUF4465 domain-containing protein [Muribaculaceae bacterium]